MADKTLKINIVADKSGLVSISEGLAGISETAAGTAAKVTTIYDQLAKVSQEVKTFASLQGQAYKDLQTKIATYNDLVKAGHTAYEVAMPHVKQLLADYNAEVNQAITLQRTLNNAINLSATAAKSDGRRVQYPQGTVADNRASADVVLEQDRVNKLTAIRELEQRQLARIVGTEQVQLRYRQAMEAEDNANRLRNINAYVAATSDASGRVASIRAKELSDLRADITQRNDLERQKYRDKISSGMSQGAKYNSNSLVAGLSSSGALRESTLAAEEAARAQKKLADSLEETGRAHKNIVLHIAEVLGIYKILNFTVNSTINAIKAIPRIGIELDSTKASLEATVGAGAKAGSALAALDKEAERTGINITTLRENFRGFQASTSLAGESLDSTWHMFTNLNTVITGLHLSADKANGIFLAMAQIFNKSKVQSEELVKQLGNLLPGAFASFAAATGRTTMELTQAMKNGLVFAHNEVEKFTTFMAERFAVSFELASQGLNANVGRMQTSFTHLGEAIYETTSGPMNSAVKGITSIGDYLTEAVKGTNNFGKTISALADVALAALIIALGKATIGFTATTAAMVRSEMASRGVTASVVLMEKAFAFISIPTAILTGIAAVALHLRGLAAEADDAVARVNAVEDAKYKQSKARTAEERINFKVEDSPEVKAALADEKILKDTLDRMKSTQKALNIAKDATGAFGNGGSEAGNNYAEKHQAYLLAVKHVEEVRIAERAKLEAEESKVHHTELTTRADDDLKIQLALEARKTTLKSAQRAAELQYERNFDEVILRKKELVAKGNATDATETEKATAKAAAQALVDIEKGKQEAITKATDDFNKQQEAKANKSHNAVLKDARDVYADMKRGTDLDKEGTQTYIKNLEEQYAAGTISINKFYADKRAALIKSIEEQQAINAQGMAKAASVGDTASVEKFKDEIAKLNEQSKQIDPVITKDKNKDLEEYNKSLAETNAQVFEIKGQYYEAAKARAELHRSEKVKLYEANGNKQALADEELIQKNLTLEDRINGLHKDRNVINTQYNEDLQKINVLINAGGLSQLGSLMEINKLNKKRIDDLQRIVDLEEEEIAKVGGDSVASAKIRNEAAKARGELASLRAEGNMLANHFTAVVGTAFENTFANVVTGSMSAKEAFNSLSNSIQQEIAKIVASEIRSSILQPLFKQGLGMLMGAMGGGENSASFTATMNSSNFWTAKADGGAVTGLSGASGTVLTTPTMFPGAKVIPFASGGVLAGEAGAEGVFPLARGSNGKLGIKAIGSNSGNSSGITIQSMVISVQEKEGTTSEEQAKMIGESIKTQLKTLIQEQLVTSQRSGGTLNPTSMVASF